MYANGWTVEIAKSKSIDKQLKYLAKSTLMDKQL